MRTSRGANIHAHGMGFAGARLAVRHHSAAAAQQRANHGAARDTVVHVCLRAFRHEQLVVVKLANARAGNEDAQAVVGWVHVHDLNARRRDGVGGGDERKLPCRLGGTTCFSSRRCWVLCSHRFGG